MDNHIVLTGAVMLETMWKTRKKDLIDLVAPFIIYSIAKKTSVGEIINKEAVLITVRSDFGFTDMPSSIVDIVLNRNKDEFKRQKGVFFLIKPLDTYVSELEGRREECERRIETICNQLVSYINSHVKSKNKITKSETVDALHGFFSRQGLFLGTNRLEDYYHDYSNNMVDFYIAQFFLEKKESGAIEYNYAIDLVKGFFLQAAIYFQKENSDLVSSSYKNVSFYFDTPFLLRLLGYKTESEEENAKLLYELLKKQKGKFFCFKHTQLEVGRILASYKNNLGKPRFRTLEGLDRKKYSIHDVERLEHTWVSSLKTNYSISVDNSKINRNKNETGVLINEKELYDQLSKNIKYRESDSVEPDLQSAIGIHNNRDDFYFDSLERCGCIFVTSNSTLVKEVNQYYKSKFGIDAFQLFISDSELSALTWIKNGNTDNNLPEMQLLKNAYMALQPSSEMMEKFVSVLSKMQGEGKITADVAAAIRTSRFACREIKLASFGGIDSINEDVVADIEAKLRDDFSKEARLDERKKANDNRTKEYHERMEKADSMARDCARESYTSMVKKGKGIALAFCFVLMAGAILGFFFSIKEIKVVNIVSFGLLFLFSIVSLLSIYDVVNGRIKYLSNWIMKIANRHSDKIYRKKRDEYDLLLSNQNSSEERDNAI